MVKVNVICDGNYLLYKNVFILKKSRTIKKDLKILLENDLKKIKQLFHFNNFYFVSDTKVGSWRKTFFPEYKAHREKDKSIDWDFVFNTYNDFKDELKERSNIKFLELDYLEADDIISYIIKESNDEGFSNVIISSDGDLQQLLGFDLNKNYVNIQWNYKFNNSRIYLPKNYQLMIDKFTKVSENMDLFNMNTDVEFLDFFDGLITKNIVVDVSPEESLFTKIVQGDKGDNIPSIAKTKGGQFDLEEGRNIGVNGSKTVYNIYKDLYPEEIDIYSDEFIERLTDVIIFHKKLKGNEENKDILRNNISFNRKLISLTNKFIPDNVFKRLEDYYIEIKNKKYKPKKIEIELTQSDEDFFNEKIDIPEEFRVEKSEGEKFNPDSFWEI